MTPSINVRGHSQPECLGAAVEHGSDGRSPRLGRPPLTDIRRVQILDAVENCIVEYGLAGTTVERIAHHAGLSRSAVNHFVGSKDEVIDAALARSVGRLSNQFRDGLGVTPPAERIERFVEIAVDPDRPGRTLAIILVDEVTSVAHRNEHARAHLAGLYAEVEGLVRDIVMDRYPDASPERVAMTAEALVLLLREADRVRTLEVCSAPQDMPRRAKAMASALLTGFEAFDAA